MAQRTEVAACDRRGGLDLDGDDRRVASFQQFVDLAFVLVAVVVQAQRFGLPLRLAVQFGDGEGLEGHPGRGTVLGDATGVKADER